MSLRHKTKPIPSDAQPKDRLTFSAWPPRVEGIGKGVRPAFIIALAIVGLLLTNIVVGTFRTPTTSNYLAKTMAYAWPKSR